MLQVKDLSCAYNGIRALRGVSLDVAEGSAVALIGPNGAGKSTLMNALSGIVRAEGGIVAFNGERIERFRPHRIARRGLLQVPEGRQILAPLTVLENLALGHSAAAGRARPDTLERVFAMFPVLAERRDQLGGSLSGGQQQMLAIGRALMGEPRILLLDEPSLGLAPIVIRQVFAALDALNRAGLTLLLVEQNARLALAHTSRAYVLERGHIVRQGASAELLADPSIVEHYLGADPAHALVLQP